MRYFRYFLFANILALSGVSTYALGQTITAWCYYSTVPFQTETKNNAGLAQDLVHYLNQELAGKRRLHLLFLPRNRLDLALSNAEKGIVLFAPSMTFGGIANAHYLWSAPLLDDHQGFISRADKPFNYDTPASLFGTHLLTVRGHNFPRLQQEIDEGKIILDRADNEISLIRMLLAKRADIITLPDSVVHYFTVKNPEFKSQLHLSSKKLESFSRHLMLQKGMDDELTLLEPIVLRMNSDPKWIAILKKYGLEPRLSSARQAQTTLTFSQSKPKPP